MLVKKQDFGPNQDEVDALLERLETVDQGQALFLAGLARDDEATQAARDAMLNAARGGAREAELDRARREVTRWVNTWFSGGFQLSGYGRDITRPRQRPTRRRWCWTRSAPSSCATSSRPMTSRPSSARGASWTRCNRLDIMSARLYCG